VSKEQLRITLRSAAMPAGSQGDATADLPSPAPLPCSYKAQAFFFRQPKFSALTPRTRKRKSLFDVKPLPTKAYSHLHSTLDLPVILKGSWMAEYLGFLSANRAEYPAIE
jgi:hypothetical protein